MESLIDWGHCILPPLYSPQSSSLLHSNPIFIHPHHLLSVPPPTPVVSLLKRARWKDLGVGTLGGREEGGWREGKTRELMSSIV